MRRSSLVGEEGWVGVPAGAPPSAVPQAMQKRAPAGADVPQEGQSTARALPQAMQKAAPSGLEASQLGQGTAVCAMVQEDDCANRGQSRVPHTQNRAALTRSQPPHQAGAGTA